jgi:HK97 family phage major capsid protein
LTTAGIPYVATGVAAGMPAATAGADFVISMIQKLPAAYRQGASFIAASAMVSTIRTLKDSTGGYLWQPSLVAGTPSTLAGYTVTEAEEMPAVAANAFPIAFGNVSMYPHSA